mmetsp:Transcript_14015/g.42760  ORF Transcript_14015/g.42760 Transcript_14015/m.42760 type:complete len:243 (+) Transcript_14015:88-816(+)
MLAGCRLALHHSKFKLKGTEAALRFFTKRHPVFSCLWLDFHASANKLQHRPGRLVAQVKRRWVRANWQKLMPRFKTREERRPCMIRHVGRHKDYEPFCTSTSKQCKQHKTHKKTSGSRQDSIRRSWAAQWNKIECRTSGGGGGGAVNNVPIPCASRPASTLAAWAAKNAAKADGGGGGGGVMRSLMPKADDRVDSVEADAPTILVAIPWLRSGCTPWRPPASYAPAPPYTMPSYQSLPVTGS